MIRIPFTRRTSRFLALLLAGAGQAGCASTETDPALRPPPTDDSPPWSGEPLARSAVPPVYLQEWEAAENRTSCALLAPASQGEGGEAAPRAATFGGGWGVAYDQPGLRSAFGVAGTGAEADAPSFHDWPHSVEWQDGSYAGYGPEGGSGPNQLAYLRVQGQSCLYNVWSRLGRAHLEYLLEQLRFVAGE